MHKKLVTYDFIIMGGGIIGLSTACEIMQKHPASKVLLLEQEERVACHQTGRNSGVIHAGVYYQPGSLKADYCARGNIQTKEFCQEHSIAYDECGKLLVATDDQELHNMHALHTRIQQNNIACERLTQQQVAAREPNIHSVGALFIPSTAIVNYGEVARKMAQSFSDQGGTISFNSRVTALQEEAQHIQVSTQTTTYQAGYFIACGGINADTILAMTGIQPDFKMIPFRGEYFLLNRRHNQLVNHLIYPIPNPDLPFLGIHLTKMIEGTVTLGPNAALALGKYAYNKLDINVRDMAQILSYSGFYRMMTANYKAVWKELKSSFSQRYYLKKVQKYCSLIEHADLLPYRSGIRAQAVSTDGTLIEDFYIRTTARSFHVCNAPSPAATSAMPIAHHLVSKIEQDL